MKYAVSVPISGYVYKEVEANSEEEAREAVFMSGITIDEVEEFDMHDHIVKGNVFYGVLNEIEIEEIGE